MSLATTDANSYTDEDLGGLSGSNVNLHVCFALLWLDELLHSRRGFNDGLDLLEECVVHDYELRSIRIYLFTLSLHHLLHRQINSMVVNRRLARSAGVVV